MLTGGVYSMFDAPASTQTQALDINNAGQIVGQFIDGSGGNHGYLLNGGVFTTIDFPAAQGGVGGDLAEGINDAGQISGRYCSTTQCNGFYFDGMNYSALSVGPGNVEAFDINNLGQIGGVTDAHGFIISNGIVSTIAFLELRQRYSGDSMTLVRRLAPTMTVPDCMVTWSKDLPAHTTL